MKKIFAILLVTVLLCGCAKAPEASKPVTTNPTETTIPEETTIPTEERSEGNSETATVAITYGAVEETTKPVEEETVHWLFDIDHVTNYEKELVPTYSMAMELASVIYKYIEKPEGTENYVAVGADGVASFLDILVVYFSSGTMEQIYAGEVDFCLIALDSRTGRVCSVHFKEKGAIWGQGD